MEKKFTAKASVTIDQPAAKVWEALTEPKLIKKYLFGTTVKTDWKIGSPITYEGVWEGKPYKDKGKILHFIPKKLLQSTFLSGSSGLEDKPENYALVTYELNEKEGGTNVVVKQDRCPSRQACKDSEKNWRMVLKGLKELLEN